MYEIIVLFPYFIFVCYNLTEFLKSAIYIKWFI